MTDRERAATMISIYRNLLRIQAARDKETEVENQLCEARAKLRALGIVVDDLVIRRESDGGTRT